MAELHTQGLSYESSIAQLAGFVEYTDCISEKRWDHSNKRPAYDIKQSDAEAPIMLDLGGIRSTSPLPSLPCLLWPGVVVPERVLFMDRIEQFDIYTVCKQMTYAKLNCLIFNPFTVCESKTDV